MKVDAEYNDASSWFTVETTPTEFDGFPPIPALRIDWPIFEFSADRMAVALSLIYAPWISGRIDFNGPMSPLTEQRIVEWFQSQSIWVAPNPVRVGGINIPRGRRTVLYGTSRAEASDTISITPVDSLSGSESAAGDYRIACNFDALLRNAPSELHKHHMQLGFAVLLAESLDVGAMVSPEFAAQDTAAFGRAARLLECVSLGLRRE